MSATTSRKERTMSLKTCWAPVEAYIDGKWLETGEGTVVRSVDPTTRRLADHPVGHGAPGGRRSPRRRQAFDSGEWPRMTPTGPQRRPQMAHHSVRGQAEDLGQNGASMWVPDHAGPGPAGGGPGLCFPLVLRGRLARSARATREHCPGQNETIVPTTEHVLRADGRRGRHHGLQLPARSRP